MAAAGGQFHNLGKLSYHIIADIGEEVQTICICLSLNLEVGQF